ncbi:MAG: carboxyl transferase domain-containing protein [Bacteroidales bacterium]
MHVLESNLDINSSEFKQNKKAFQKLIDELDDKLLKCISGGDAESVERHKIRGKLLARDRIHLLLDSGTPFLELSPMACVDQYDNKFPSAGIVCGIGLIHGQEVMVIANDATVKGGTYMKYTLKKHIRAQEIALENHLPCIYLVDSGGAFLPEQDTVFPDRENFGRLFYNQAQMSSKGISQVSIVMGSCTAGGAYVPAMSDETIIVKGQGTIFLGGPPLVKVATGEDVSAEELGGAEVHTSISGVADHLAEDDEHALQICRSIFEIKHKRFDRQKLYVKEVKPPIYDPRELYGIAPIDYRKILDPREIIMRMVDGSEFNEFKANYAPTIVTGFARIMGFPIGIIANHGVLFSESALKATHFIELCDHRRIPLLFLQNITGFIVGKKYEHQGIAKDGAKMVHAVANAKIPKFTVIVGGSFGAGNYAMAGRAFDPRFLFMWPNAKISVMGGDQAAHVLTEVKRQQYYAQGKELSDKEISELKFSILNKYEKEGSAYYSTSRLWDDGIIDPVDTRMIIALGISVSRNKKWPEPKYGIFRM